MKRVQMFTLFGGCHLLVSNQEGVNIPQCQLLHINNCVLQGSASAGNNTTWCFVPENQAMRTTSQQAQKYSTRGKQGKQGKHSQTTK